MSGVDEKCIYQQPPFYYDPDVLHQQKIELKGMPLNEWSLARKKDAIFFYDKSNIEKKASIPDLFKSFYTSLLFVQHCSQVIRYEEVLNEEAQINVFVIGNIGAGKSCLLNKLYQMIKNIAIDQEKAKNYKLNNDVDFDVKMFISLKNTASTTR